MIFLVRTQGKFDITLEREGLILCYEKCVAFDQTLGYFNQCLSDAFCSFRGKLVLLTVLTCPCSMIVLEMGLEIPVGETVMEMAFLTTRCLSHSSPIQLK